MAGHKQTGPRFPLLQTEPRTVPAPAPVRPRPTGSCSAPATARPRPADPRRSLRPSHLPRAPPPRYGRAGELGSRSRVSTTRISRTESLTPGTAETRDGAGTAAAGSRDNLPPRFRAATFTFSSAEAAQALLPTDRPLGRGGSGLKSRPPGALPAGRSGSRPGDCAASPPALPTKPVSFPLLPFAGLPWCPQPLYVPRGGPARCLSQAPSSVPG